MTTRLDDEIRMVRLGANDPSFNLRRDPAFILRRTGVATTTFASVLETHGSYSPRDEIPRTPYGRLANLEMVVDQPDYVALRLTHFDGSSWLLLLAQRDNSAEATHQLNINGRTHAWEGVHHLLQLTHASK